MSTRHEQKMEIRDRVLDAFRRACLTRHERDDWVEFERQAMTAAANAYAANHHLASITVWDVEEIEHRAMGHVDYGPKLALYIAELVLDRTDVAQRLVDIP